MATPEYGEVWLDGTAFPLAGPVQVQANDRFPGKITVGDYSLDSNDLLSTWAISDLTGGHGIAEHQEGTTDNRFRFGNLNTRYPRQWVPSFKRYGQVNNDGYIYPLGDMTVAGTTARYFVASVVGAPYLQFDVMTGTSSAFTTVGPITGVPTDKAVAFAGTAAVNMLYVPQGLNGYTVYDRSGPTKRNVLGNTFVSFCLWDNKLIGIDTTGQLYYATQATAAADTTFTSYGTTAKLDPSRTPKHLLVYYNRRGDPAVYVVTNTDVWVFDPDTPTLYLIPDLGSPNPAFGAGACVWRGSLYISSGMDVYEYTGSVRRNIGLSRDDGPSERNHLPYQYGGQIVDLVPGQNALYAYVKGSLVSGSVYYASMQEYSGLGWHTTWTSPRSGSGPSWAAITRTGGTYSLWWGDLGKNSTYANHGFMPLPVNDTNPIEALGSGAYSFGADGTLIVDDAYILETGWFDGGMPNYTKIANSLKVVVDPTSGVGGIDSFSMFYRIDGASAYTSLGLLAFDANGEKTVVLGTVDANGVAAGFAFKRIEFKFFFALSPTSTANPLLVKYLAFTFRKVMNPSLAWTLPIDLSGPYRGNSPAALRTKLTTLRTTGTFFSYKHLQTNYRVALAAVSGSENTGKDLRGQVMVSVLEIPQDAGAGVTALS